MRFEEMIAKIGEMERTIYTAAQMATDVRAIIVGLYEEKMWWREKYINLLSEKETDDDFDKEFNKYMSQSGG
jgi:hypothetical protein